MFQHALLGIEPVARGRRLRTRPSGIRALKLIAVAFDSWQGVRCAASPAGELELRLGARGQAQRCRRSRARRRRRACCSRRRPAMAHARWTGRPHAGHRGRDRDRVRSMRRSTRWIEPATSTVSRRAAVHRARADVHVELQLPSGQQPSGAQAARVEARLEARPRCDSQSGWLALAVTSGRWTARVLKRTAAIRSAQRRRRRPERERGASSRCCESRSRRTDRRG